MQLEIDKQIVKEYLTTLNEFKSPGPDELHSSVLKELAEELSEPLYIIFLKSWEMGGARTLKESQCCPYLQKTAKKRNLGATGQSA